jgi:hypothetical protein
LPSSLTPEVAKTTGVFYEMARWFSNRPFLVMFTPPLAQMAQKNINIEILRPIRVPVPPLKEQERFVKAVEALESKIATARALLRAAPARKEAILKKHL